MTLERALASCMQGSLESMTFNQRDMAAQAPAQASYMLYKVWFTAFENTTSILFPIIYYAIEVL